MGQGLTNIFKAKVAFNNNNLQKEHFGHQKNYKTVNINKQKNKVGGPDGQGQKISSPKAQPLLDPGPDDHNIPNLRFKDQNIKRFFKDIRTVNFDVEIMRLNKEMRLAQQRKRELE